MAQRIRVPRERDEFGIGQKLTVLNLTGLLQTVIL